MQVQGIPEKAKKIDSMKKRQRTVKICLHRHYHSEFEQNSKSQENCLILLSPNEKRRKNWYNLKLDCFKAKFMLIKK